MKLFKLTDLIAQVLILASGLLHLVLAKHPVSFLFLYYVMGGWQLCSFFIHLRINDSWVARKDRTQYGKTLGWILAAGLLSLLLLYFQLPVVIFLLLALLIISPVLAAWYFIIGTEELQAMKRKELIHLK
jgi:hypothetical protein